MTHRVGVNLLWLRPGEVGGSEEYLCRQLTGLVESGLVPSAFEPVLFVVGGFARAHPELAAALEVVEAPVSGANRALRVAVEAAWLPGAARRAGVELMHHGGGAVPAASVSPALVTIHDLQVMAYPRYFSPVKRAWLRHTLPAAARRARMVLTPSEFVRSTVVQILGADPATVRVVPHGIPHSELLVGATPAASVRERYDLPGPFVVYPAMTWPHKNHALLVRAVAALAERGRDLVVVFTGGQAGAESALHAEVGRLRAAGLVRRPGRVPLADLAGLYEAAVACAFPSRYEGFGAPVLEAMRRGCPVVAARAASLPEVVGDAGVLLDPDDVEAWAATLGRLCDDPPERARLGDAGRARAASFTGDHSAAALAAAYRAVLEAPGD